MSNAKTSVGIIGYGLIGQAIASHLREKGYPVYVFDISDLKVENFIKMDICSEKSVIETVSSLKEKNIQIHSFVNCSYPRGPNYGKSLEDVTLESFNQNVNLHLGGYFNVMKQFGFYLKDIGGGSVISFSSIYGVVAPRFEIYDNLPFTMPVEYAAVKAALQHLNKYMAKFFKGHDVRFNSISPGGIFNAHDKKFVEAYGEYSLSSAQGMILPQELAGVVEFLISSAASHINGHSLVVDDGWTL